MVKKIIIIFVFLITAYILNITSAFTREDAKKKAKEIHDIASSDIIYAEQELKALYYQNIQIIDLLQEIRDFLQQQLEKTSLKGTP